jgi:ATP-dependent Clp protease protease subunit
MTEEKDKSKDIKEEEEETSVIMFSDVVPSEPSSRTIGLYGEVNEEKCKTVVGGLLLLKGIENNSEEEEEEKKIDPIELVVSTEGGNVCDMFSVCDTMRLVRRECEVHTFGIGKVMSAGVLILATGTKGKRQIGKNCRLMLHAVVGGEYGSYKEVRVSLNEIEWYQNRFIKSLAQESKLSMKEIRAIFDKKTDTYFDAEQAVEWGIADEVV